MMSISSTGLYGSASIMNNDLFNDVEALKEQVTTLSTSYLITTQEHRDDISQNRLDISHMYVCMYVYTYVCMYVCTYMLRPN